MAYVQRKIPFVGTPETNPETKPFFDGCAAGKLVLPRCKDTGKFIWYPRGDLAVHLRSGGMGGSVRQGHDLHVQRDAARRSALLRSPMSNWRRDRA